MDAATLNEKVYGKPWYAGARSLIYRKDFLEKAGVEPPKTWEDMSAAAKAVKEKVDGVYAIGIDRALRAHVPADRLAGGWRDRDPGRGHLEERAQLARGRAGVRLVYASFYKDGLAPKAAIGWEEPGRADRVHQR